MSGAIGAFKRVARDSGLPWACTLALDRVFGIGVMRLWPERFVTADALRAQVGDILESWGMSEEHRSITTGYMLYADLRGIDSHGCAMLPSYHERYAGGRLVMKPAIEVVLDGATTALLDGGGGLGHVAADAAMRLAVGKARRNGLGAVAVRNSWHYGAAGAYALMAAEHGLIGLATTSTPTPVVVPTRGARSMLGTNPLAFAAPATVNRPFLLDMATSTVSRGKLLERWRRGRSIPVGWATDPRGAPSTNGRAASAHRRLTPLGADPDRSSHKGYGLAVMVELLSSGLPGLRSSVADGEALRSEVGHFFLAIDPAAFGAGTGLPSAVDQLVDALRACPPADPKQPVLVPGDPEEATLAERTRGGIPLSRDVFEEIRRVALASRVRFRLEGAR